MNRNLLLRVMFTVAISLLLLPSSIYAGDPPGTASVMPTVTYDGWVGTGYHMICNDLQCNDTSGCSGMAVNQYDWYFPQYRCETGGESDAECRQFMKLCRETKTYDGSGGSGCSGVLRQWSQNFYGACASG